MPYDVKLQYILTFKILHYRIYICYKNGVHNFNFVPYALIQIFHNLYYKIIFIQQMFECIASY